MVKRRNRKIGLAEAQNWRCAWCGGVMDEREGRPDSATVEHLTPVRLGGSNRRDNLVSACASCNMSRAACTASELFSVSAAS